MKKLFFLFFVFVCSVNAQTSITINNPSFETHNAWTSTTIPPGAFNAGPIPSWTATLGNDGSWQPDTSEFTTVPDGTIVALVDGAGGVPSRITQDLSVTALVDTTYTLTFYVGRRNDGVMDGSTWVASLYIGSTQACTVSGPESLIALGTFVKQILTCTTGNTVPSGDVIISLGVSGGTNQQAAFDNVALSYVQTPTFPLGINLGGAIADTTAAPWVWSGPAGSCGTPPSVTSTSGSSLCIGDSNGAVNASVNGDAWLPLTRTVGKGTATFATTAISAGACSAIVTPALTAIASTDTIKWSYQTQPTAGTDAALDMQYWPTAGTGLNFKRCNNTGASINPTAVVINWEITR